MLSNDGDAGQPRGRRLPAVEQAGAGKNGPGKNGPGKNGPGKNGPEKTVR